MLVNDDDLTYAKIRLDDRSLRTLIAGIADFTDSLPAALCWAAAWDMVRDAELAARDYVKLVLSGAGSIREISMLQTVLRQAAAAIRRYADPAWRRSGLEQLAAALRDWLQQAEPGSDHQLAFAQALADVATTPADLDLLARLLDGSTAIDGLAVDTELRWRLLRRLVSRGQAGPAQIEAELGRDRTDAGERHAAASRASIPEPAAKAAAWDQIMAGTLPSATFRAALGGFRTRTTTSCWRRTRRDSLTWWRTSGGTGAPTWPSTSPRMPIPSRSSASRRSTTRPRRSGAGTCPPRCAGC